MKNLFFAFLAVLFVSVSAVNAAVVVNNNDEVSFVQDEKVKIKAEELPEAVRTVLQGEGYNDWTIVSAYHIKAENQYEVELKKEAETKTLKFDNEGNVIE